MEESKLNDTELSKKEILLKEIDLIEDCIKRMSNNSFLLKGWAVTILSVLIGLMANFENWTSGSLLAIFVCIGFWYLDALYLKLERLYTRKYNWVIQNRLDTTEYKFNLNPFEKNMWLETENREIITLKVMFSRTLLPLYLTMLIVSSCGLWLSYIRKIIE